MKKNKTNANFVLSLFLLILIDFTYPSFAQTSESEFYASADLFFKTNVDENGQVAYETIKNKPELINKLYKQINNYSSNEKSANELKAFYANAYNILVIKQVIDKYPIYGPLKVDGFFDKIKHSVAGEMLTLNEVEKDKNLYINKDERLHFTLVCGAKGCPPLANYAFSPEKINEQLEERTKYALADENFIRLEKKKVGISQIFNWYADDFKDKGVDGIVGYLNKYRKKQILIDSKIVYYEYNWELNKQ